MDTLSQLLNSNYNRIKTDKKWTNKSRIIGEAIEDCVIVIPCPICNEKALIKYKTNEKSKDVMCEKCNSQIQIKATKKTNKNKSTLKLLGAEYKTTCSSIKENNIHYLIFIYSVINDIYSIDDILFVDRININENCIIPRNPLGPTARRAGWQGCILVFDTFKSIKIFI